MERKKYDLFINMLSNPQSSIDGLIVSGLSVDNTSLLDKSVYENDDVVRKEFEKDNGEFDKVGFDKFYDLAKIFYNYMSQTSFNKALENSLTYHRSNTFEDVNKRSNGPQFYEYLEANPLHIVTGAIMPGIVEMPRQSEDECMLANKVLLNPTTAGDNLENAKWDVSPNDGFFKYFFDTLVLARYDSDGTHTDLMTGETVKHKAGELKLDETGNYYYEKLDGRSVYDKVVLNKGNVLTTDGSWANLFDFFDSDDMNQKSLIGSVLKNTALVGSMFLPHVGPWIAGLSIATLMAGLIGTIGKMATSSDNSKLSALEGWSKSLSRQYSTQYASEHPWCLENMINLIGDVVGLLREQRVIFKYVPAAFKGRGLINKDNEAAFLSELTSKYLKSIGAEMKTLKDGSNSVSELLLSSLILQARATAAAQREMDSFIKGYNKIGEIISRGWMTAVTVGDTYGEAKSSGASDLDATLLTLGYAIGEYQLLRTGLGRWNIPETRLYLYRHQAMAKALGKLQNEAAENAFSSAKKKLSELSIKEGKKQYVKKALNIGKQLAKDVWSAEKSNGTKTAAAVLNSSLGEGVEEVSEELLADFSKGCYNVVKWLLGEDTRLNTFGYDYATESWNGADIRDRYLLSLVGGFVGGGITNVRTNYKMINSFNKMNHRQAVELLVYMARNGELDKFMRDVNKMTLDDPNLSTNFLIINNQVVFDAGTKTDNRDLALKRAILELINIVLNILSSNGALPDSKLLDIQTLGDLRFVVLLQSTTAGAYILEYNTLLSEIIKDSEDIRVLASRDLDTNANGRIEDRELRHGEISENTLLAINKKKEAIKENKKKLDDLISGKRSLEFIQTALFETTEIISGAYESVTFPLYLLLKYNKTFSQLTDEEKRQYLEEYKTWKTTEGRDRILTAARIFVDLAKLYSLVVKDHELTYLSTSQELIKINEEINSLLEDLNYEVDNDKFIGDFQELVKIPERAILSNQSADLAYRIITILGTEDLKNLLKELLLKRSKKDITEDEIKLLNLEYTELIKEASISSLHQYVQTFLDRGFINLETKNLLTNLVKLFRTRYVDVLYGEEEEKYDEGLVDENIYAEVRDLLIIDVQSLNKLSETPIEQNLDKFAISLGNEPINLTLLVEKVDKALNNTSDNISNFNTNLKDELDNAIDTMLLYLSLVEASRRDNIGINNLFGFNATLNEISKKTGEDLQLAEIDAKVADLFIADIKTNLNKLQILLRLFLINLGQKLSKLDRVSVRKDLLFYDRLNYITKILPKLTDWKGIDELTSVVQNLEYRVQMLAENNNMAEDEEKFQKDNLTLENAVYDFFQANKDVLENPEKLAQLINPDNLNLYSNSEKLLNEDMNLMDDNSLVWWLASRAALRASDFYNVYKSVIQTNEEKPLAPIATLELAIYNNVASIVNGNVFDAFYKAVRLSMVMNWNQKSVAERLEILKKLGKPVECASDELEPYSLTIIPVPRYKNIILTEGIPGSGKTSAVYKLTVKMLKTINSDILKNVYIVHGANKSSADNLKNDIEVEGESFGRNSFMKRIRTNWKDLESSSVPNLFIVPVTDFDIVDTEIPGHKDIRSKLGISNVDKIPSLIIIDEISRFSSYDLDLIDKFAQTHGITVLVSGDFDLSGIIGKHKIPQDHAFDNFTWEVNLERTNFIRSPKLGVSMRTDNTLKTNNLTKTLLYINNPEGKLTLNYAENELGLFGDKVIHYTIDVLTDLDGNIDPNSQSSKNLLTDDILKEIDKLASTLKEGEKIGYIFNDKTSKLYQELSKRSYIELHEGGSALGLEGRYYIIDLGYNINPNILLKDIYTGISRASLGSLIIAPIGNHESIIPLESELNNEVPIKELALKSSIIKYAAKRKMILDNVVKDGNIPSVVKRSTEKPEVKREGDLSRGVTAEELAERERLAKELAKLEVIRKIQNASSILEVLNILNANILFSADTDVLNAKNAKVLELNRPTVEPEPTEKFKVATAEEVAQLWPMTLVNGIIANIDGVDVPLSFKPIPFVTILKNNEGKLIFGYSNIIDYDGRKIVLVDINGHILPFYESSGLNPKDGVNPGHWYPFFGISDELGWLNKGSTKEQYKDTNFYIPSYYGDSNLKAICEALDNTLGTNHLLYVGCPRVDLWAEYEDGKTTRDFINQSFDQVYEDGSGVNDNITKAINTISLEIKVLRDLFKIPETPLPEIDEDPEVVITGVDIVNTLQFNELLDLANLLKLIPISDVSPISENNTIPISMLTHSFNTIETGVLEGPNGEVILIGSDTLKAMRIDSVNGLLKIDAFHGMSPRRVKDYVKMIADLRNIIFNNRDKADIEKYLKDYLDLPSIYATFALKSSPYSQNNTSENGYFGGDSPYNKSIKERILFNDSLDSRSLEVCPKSIVLIIGTEETGDILELPLLTLSSPFSLIHLKKDGNYVFGEVRDEFIRLITDNRTLSEISYILVNKFIGRAEYKELILLFLLFNATGGFVKYIYDLQWTPLRNLLLLGGSIVTKKGFHQIAEGLSYDVNDPDMNWVDLNDFATPNEMKYRDRLNPHYNPGRYVTKIFLSESNIFPGTDKEVLNAGHPFVLISHDSSLNNDEKVIKQYAKLVADPTEPEIVSLCYIRPPKATVRQYLESIRDIILGRPKLNIGYFSTSFKFLKTMSENEEFKALAERKLGPLVYAKVVEALDKIPKDADITDLKIALNNVEDWSLQGIGDGPHTLMYLFRKVLYNLSSITFTLDGNDVRLADDLAIDLILNIAGNLGIDGIYRHFPFPREDNNSNGYFIVPQLDNYSLDGYPCHIHAKVIPYTFKGLMGSFISDLISKFNNAKGYDPVNPKGSLYWRTPDNPKYFGKNSKLGSNRLRSIEDLLKALRDREIKSITDVVKAKTGVELIPEYFEGKTLEQVKEQLVYSINSRTSKIAFILNGNLIISETALLAQNKVIYNNENLPISDITLIILTSGLAIFTVALDNKLYQATYNGVTLELIDMSEQQLQTVLPRVTAENFNEYINEGKKIFDSIFEYDVDLLELFNATSYEEFMQAMDNFLGMDPYEDFESFRLYMFSTLTPENDMLKLIIEDISALELNSKRTCPIPIKITF